MRVQTPALVALAIFLAVVAYTLGDEGSHGPMTIYEGSGGQIPAWHRDGLPPDRWVGIVLDRVAWDRLPIETGHTRILSDIRPSDFATSVSVVAYMGMMPTGGHKISVREVRYSPGAEGVLGRVTIVLDVTSPAPEEIVTQALTHPVEAITIRHDRWPTGALEAVAAGVVLVDAVDQDGRSWGPVHVQGELDLSLDEM